MAFHGSNNILSLSGDEFRRIIAIIGHLWYIYLQKLVSTHFGANFLEKEKRRSFLLICNYDFPNIHLLNIEQIYNSI